MEMEACRLERLRLHPVTGGDIDLFPYLFFASVPRFHAGLLLVAIRYRLASSTITLVAVP